MKILPSLDTCLVCQSSLFLYIVDRKKCPKDAITAKYRHQYELIINELGLRIVYLDINDLHINLYIQDKRISIYKRPGGPYLLDMPYVDGILDFSSAESILDKLKLLMAFQ